MGRGKRLNKEQTKKIKTLKKAGFSLREIGKRVGCSRNAVFNYLQDPESYGQRYKGGKKRVTTEHERRDILKIASHSLLSARQIRTKLGATASVRTIQRVLKESSKNESNINQPGFDARLEFADQQFTPAYSNEEKTELENRISVPYPDEKKSSLKYLRDFASMVIKKEKFDTFTMEENFSHLTYPDEIQPNLEDVVCVVIKNEVDTFAREEELGSTHPMSNINDAHFTSSVIKEEAKFDPFIWEEKLGHIICSHEAKPGPIGFDSFASVITKEEVKIEQVDTSMEEH
ncbi:unnamed protein product [Hermetia illucens]|uniref:Tc3 transposase DNA binding domain-containing protein n=1 Tax=Hermetia illucens TaxID=343691 RepID=A0A7R8YPD0_HERIL|nr:unnamed protein product [Hermetia illucens]